MADEITNAERAKAEIEQGRHYRKKPVWKVNWKFIQNQNFWIAVMCTLLFLSGLNTALIRYPTGIDFEYWNPLGSSVDKLTSTLGTCFWAGMLIWLISRWKRRVRIGATCLFLLLPILVMFTSQFPILNLGEGNREVLSVIHMSGQMYHLESMYFSGVYSKVYECDGSGTWCHRVHCYPYDEAQAFDLEQHVPEYYFPICATGESPRIIGP